MQLLRLENHGKAAERGEPDAAGQAAEPLDRNNVDGREPRRGIQPQPYRRARERREPQVVAEGVRDERREHHARIGHGLAQITQAEQVVETQSPVAERGDEQGRADVRHRDAAQLLEDVAQVQVRHLPVQHKGDAAEYRERGNRPDPVPDRRSLGWGDVLCAHFRGSRAGLNGSAACT